MNGGTSEPGKIDLVTEKDGRCYLYIVQSEALDSTNLNLMQEKLNNYLHFIKEGLLEKNYPDMADHKTTVRIDLQNGCDEVAFDFLRKATRVFENEGVGLIYIYGDA